MRLFALGVNHRSAPVELRERLAGSDEALLACLTGWVEAHEGLEWAHLSTCNRYEVYLSFPEACGLDGHRVLRGLTAALEAESDEARRSFYLHEGTDAARHLFRVTASLDSQVLGEDQIQSQVKQCYAAAVEAGSTGPVLNHLFHRALRIGKRIRTETEIARSPVSVASAGVALARRVFGDLSVCRVLVLGSGEMARLCLNHLRDRGAEKFMVANRTPSRARALARDFSGEGIALDDAAARLPDADLVLAATGAPEPVLLRDDVVPAVKRRIDPLLLVDLGVPRNLDPAIDELEGTLLYNIDDLEQVTGESREARKKAAARAEVLADEAAHEFADWLTSRKVAPVIQELLGRSREIAASELNRALKKLGDLDPSVREACERAVMAAVNKLLHQPLVSLKGMPGGDEGDRTLRVVRDLFQLGEGEGASDEEAAADEEGSEEPRKAGAR